MRVFDDRYARDLHRYQLALRLIEHNARTGTVARWTGLPAKKVRAFYRSYCSTRPQPGLKRERGPSPHNVMRLMATSTLRNEAAVVGGLCKMLGAISSHRGPRAEQAGHKLKRGEALCEAFELYRRFFPEASLTLEEVMLLVSALEEGGSLTLNQCERCECLILVDRLEVPHRTCSHCRYEKRRGAVLKLEVPPDLGQSIEESDRDGSSTQIGLFS